MISEEKQGLTNPASRVSSDTFTYGEAVANEMEENRELFERNVKRFKLFLGVLCGVYMVFAIALEILGLLSLFGGVMLFCIVVFVIAISAFRQSNAHTFKTFRTVSIVYMAFFVLFSILAFVIFLVLPHHGKFGAIHLGDIYDLFGEPVSHSSASEEELSKTAMYLCAFILLIVAAGIMFAHVCIVRLGEKIRNYLLDHAWKHQHNIDL